MESHVIFLGKGARSDDGSVRPLLSVSLMLTSLGALKEISQHQLPECRDRYNLLI